MTSVYVEVGSKCFSICKTCDINDQPRPESPMTVGKLDAILTVLSKLELSDTIRFTGYEPISFDKLDDVMYRHPEFKYKILTTLLRLNSAVFSCDHLMVSLSGVGDRYRDFFKVDGWKRFLRNFDIVKRARGPARIEINTTISDVLMTPQSARRFVWFVNCESRWISNVQLFNAMRYDYVSPSGFDRGKFEEIMQRLIVPYTLTWNSAGAKQTDCHVTRETIYVKLNGDVYPCCMAGGEIGQNLVPELRVCNILDYVDKIDELRQLLKTPLRNLNNPICDHCMPKYLKLNNKWRHAI